MRQSLTSVFGWIVAGLALCVAGAGKTAHGRPPNILFILADDLGAEQLGSYGNRINQTPNLDRLAAGGTRFKTCWATPLCSPSRVELMTGRYGFRTGWYNLIQSDFTPSDHLDPQEITFGHMLKQAGYATALSGKWQLGSIRDEPNMIVENGFDQYCAWAWASLPIGAKFDGSPRRRYWHPALIENGRHRPTSPDDYGPDIQNDWIIEFMKKNKDRPFLAYYPMCQVHEPWDPTPDPSQPGGKIKGGLRANVEYLDKLVGKVLDALDNLALRDQTLIFFTGDNGTGRAGKGTLTEAGVHVPMIVSGPGVAKGQVSDALIDFSDVMPTLAELTGAKLPEKVTLDGHSFAPMLRGEAGYPREWIFSFLARGRMIRDRRWLLQGDGKLYDCDDRRDGTGYKEMSGSQDPEAIAARSRFNSVLKNLPAPGQPGAAKATVRVRRPQNRAE